MQAHSLFFANLFSFLLIASRLIRRVSRLDTSLFKLSRNTPLVLGRGIYILCFLCYIATSSARVQTPRAVIGRIILIDRVLSFPSFLF